MADYSWEDMPEGLAELLYELNQGSHRLTRLVELLPRFNDWVVENVAKCNAEAFHAHDVPAGKCGELPVVGSEFCPLHIPREELGDNG
jgi:hypothetical protein